ncbi:MAG: hypothetical protein DMG64_04655 [Acidobacteria bacterium]|nr:MAG: hypothetical protein DMG63_01020 [Acidobacteriota bacterium]PYY04528.1 MAG: hypothetical protein DMG64_04655 [Acidobacteriota bacterium]PYY22544.1 MAG: hypothetical protein DMG62_13130 [Acidobacteriota bacterium]
MKGRNEYDRPDKRSAYTTFCEMQVAEKELRYPSLAGRNVVDMFQDGINHSRACMPLSSGTVIRQRLEKLVASLSRILTPPGDSDNAFA